MGLRMMRRRRWSSIGPHDLTFPVRRKRIRQRVENDTDPVNVSTLYESGAYVSTPDEVKGSEGVQNHYVNSSATNLISTTSSTPSMEKENSTEVISAVSSVAPIFQSNASITENFSVVAANNASLSAVSAVGSNSSSPSVSASSASNSGVTEQPPLRPNTPETEGLTVTGIWSPVFGEYLTDNQEFTGVEGKPPIGWDIVDPWDSSDSSTTDSLDISPSAAASPDVATDAPPWQQHDDNGNGSEMSGGPSLGHGGTGVYGEGAGTFFPTLLLLMIAMICICLPVCRRRTEGQRGMEDGDERNGLRSSDPSRNSQDDVGRREKRREYILDHIISKTVIAPKKSTDLDDESIGSKSHIYVTAEDKGKDDEVDEAKECKGEVKKDFASSSKHACTKKNRRSITSCGSSMVTIEEDECQQQQEQEENHENPGDPPTKKQIQKLDTSDAPLACARRKSDIVGQLPREDSDDVTVMSGFTTSSKGGLTCSICLGKYVVGEKVGWSHNPDCFHPFHHDCIVQWLMDNDECPCCRGNYFGSYKDRVATP